MSGRDGILSIEKQQELAVIQGLPRSIRDIGEVYGLRIIVRLVQEYGGTRLKVPWNFVEDSEIVQRMGEEDAKKIIRHCCGDNIDVPRSFIGRKARREIIYRMFQDGARQSDIAREVGCTDRQVRNYLTSAGLTKKLEPPEPSPQIDMFK